MTPEQLRRINRLTGMNPRERAAQLNPQTPDEALAAVAGQIADEYGPKAHVERHGHVLDVTLPEGEGGRFNIFIGDDGQVVAKRPGQQRP